MCFEMTVSILISCISIFNENRFVSIQFQQFIHSITHSLLTHQFICLTSQQFLIQFSVEAQQPAIFIPFREIFTCMDLDDMVEGLWHAHEMNQRRKNWLEKCVVICFNVYLACKPIFNFHHSTLPQPRVLPILPLHVLLKVCLITSHWLQRCDDNMEGMQ